MKALWVQITDPDLFSNISRDVAIVTKFVEKWQTPLICHSGF